MCLCERRTRWRPFRSPLSHVVRTETVLIMFYCTCKFANRIYAVEKSNGKGVNNCVFQRRVYSYPVRLIVRMRRFLCRRSTAQETLPVGRYIQDLYNVDKTLIAIINKTEMEILRVTKLGSNKHVARRRLMLKKHKHLIEERRDCILGRILQLESLHVNNIQLDALRGVSKAFRNANGSFADVDALLDRLEDFKSDFEDISDRLSQDIQFGANVDVTEEELLSELEQLEHSDTSTVQKMLTSVPELPTVEKEQVDLEIENADTLLPALS